MLKYLLLKFSLEDALIYTPTLPFPFFPPKCFTPLSLTISLEVET